MNVRSIEFTIYNNLFKYLDIIKFAPIKENGKPIKKTKEEFIKTLQFYSYVKIKAENKQGEIIYVFLLSDPIFTSKSIEFKKLLNTIPEKKIHLVTVSNIGIKTPVKKFLMKYDKKKLTVKNFLYAHFKIDVRKNVLVPVHKLCTPEETKKIMEDENVDNILRFPKIKNTDPQVLWAGGNPGQLMKIIRKSVIGEVVYYRVII